MTEPTTFATLTAAMTRAEASGRTDEEVAKHAAMLRIMQAIQAAMMAEKDTLSSYEILSTVAGGLGLAIHANRTGNDPINGIAVAVAMSELILTAAAKR